MKGITEVMQQGRITISLLGRFAFVEKFTKWRTFLIKSANSKASLSSFEDQMRCPIRTTWGEKEEIDMIILTPADFGYEHVPTTMELFDPERLAEWSKANAWRLRGHVVELPPAETSQYIRDQYRDQPEGEILFTVSKEPVTDPGRWPRVFFIARSKKGELMLEEISNDLPWNFGAKILFRLRETAQDLVSRA